jgi:hypothetical protein
MARPATGARMEADARRLSDELHLSQLRKARGLTQEAEAMNGELRSAYDDCSPRAAYLELPASDFSLTQAASRAFLSASDPPGSSPLRMKPCPAPS